MKDLDVSGPTDHQNRVYIIFCWLGIGTLLPWNFFISVSEYWKHKWHTISAFDVVDPAAAAAASDGLAGANVTAPPVGALNAMQTDWTPHLAVASMVPNVTMLTLNAVFGHRFRTQPRLLVSLVMVIVLFFFTTVMTRVETDPWQDSFYYVTLASVVGINIFGAIFQGGLIGVAGKFPPRYIGGVFSGQALGGIFASATNIVLLAIGLNVVDAATFDFLIAVVFLFSALLFYALVTRSQFYQHYVAESSSDGGAKLAIAAEEAKVAMLEHAGSNDEKANGGVSVGVAQPPRAKVNVLAILGRISVYPVSVFLIFLITLGCFPGLTVLVVSVHPDTAWGQTYFIPVACFLLFNVGDYAGRALAEFVKWPRPGKFGMTLVLALSILRLAFIPLFLLCNASPHGRELTQVAFPSDIAYVLVMTAFSVSNGYLCNICMMCAPQMCEPEEQQTAASLMAALLGLGLASGSALSNYLVRLL